MARMIVSALAVLFLMPIMWVGSAIWATGLATGLVIHELRAKLCSQKKS